MNPENQLNKYFPQDVLQSKDRKIISAYAENTLSNGERALSSNSISGNSTLDGGNESIVNGDQNQDSISNLSTNAQVNHSTREVILPEKEIQRNIISTPNYYEITGIIGKGGMGVVYSAIEKKLGRSIAIKKISSSNISPSHQKKFVAEARIHAFLEHPNIAPIYELGQTQQKDILLAMKFVGGNVWSKLLEENKKVSNGQYNEEKCHRHFKIWLDVCDAVAFAHSKKIVHNDLKPDNVMVGEFNEVLLMDWGIAVDIGNNPPRTLPKNMITKPTGTMSYAPPELVAGQGQFVGQWTDVYLLGAILYQIICHTPPHTGNTLEQLMIHAYECKPPVFPTNVPSQLQKICRKALSREPQDRYISVVELQKALNSYLESSNSLRISEKGWQIILKTSHDSELGNKYNYDMLNSALEEFSAALKVDINNHQACLGKIETHYAYASLALKRKELSLAEEQATKAKKIFDSNKNNPVLEEAKQAKAYQIENTINNANISSRQQAFISTNFGKFKNSLDITRLLNEIAEKKQELMKDQQRKKLYLRSLYAAVGFIIVSLTLGIYFIRQKQLQVSLLQVQTNYERDKESLASFRSQTNEALAIISQLESKRSQLREINNRNLSLIAAAKLYLKSKDYFAAQKSLEEIHRQNQNVFTLSSKTLNEKEIELNSNKDLLEQRIVNLEKYKSKWNRQEFVDLFMEAKSNYERFQDLWKEQSFDYESVFNENEWIEKEKYFLQKYLISLSTIIEDVKVSLDYDLIPANIHSSQYFPVHQDRQVIDIWDMSRKKLSLRHQKRIAATTFSPDRKYFFSIDRTGVIYIWNATTNVVSNLDSYLKYPKDISVSLSNKYLIVEGEEEKGSKQYEEKTKVYEVGTWKEVTTFSLQGKSVISEDHMWSASQIKSPPILRVFHNPTKKYKESSYNIQYLTFSPKTNTMALASFNKVVLVQPQLLGEVQNDFELKELCSFEKENNAETQKIVWSFDELFLAALGTNGDIDIWILHRGGERLAHIFHTSANSLGYIPINIEFSAEGRDLQIWGKNCYRTYKVTPFSQSMSIKDNAIMPRYIKNSQISIFDLAKPYGIHQAAVDCGFGFSHSGNELAIAIGPAIFLWEIKNKDQKRIIYPLLHHIPFEISAIYKFRDTSFGSFSFDSKDSMLAVKLLRNTYIWDLEKIRLYRNDLSSQIEEYSVNKNLIIDSFSASHDKGIFFSRQNQKPAFLYFRSKAIQENMKNYVRYSLIVDSYRKNDIHISDSCEYFARIADRDGNLDVVSEVLIYKIDNIQTSPSTRKIGLVKHLKWIGSDAKSFVIEFVNNDQDILLGTSKGEVFLCKDWQKHLENETIRLDLSQEGMLVELPIKVNDSIKKIHFDAKSNLYWIITENSRLFICHYDRENPNRSHIVEFFPQYEKIGISFSKDYSKIVFLQKDLRVFLFEVER